MMMKKSGLFKKLLLTYGITIMISFGILALLLLKLFDQYFIDSKKQLLLDYGRKVTKEIAVSLFTGELDQQTLSEDLQILDKFLNAKIWIIDSDGTIIGVSGSNDNHYLGEKITDKELTNLRKGVNVMEIGNFGGKLSEPSMSVGYPIFFNKVFRGGVLIHAAMPEVRKSLRDIYGLTVGAIILSVILAYGVLYFQIKRISKPLREINEAAKIIAGGEFQKRLKIDTRDEIEELGQSFNNMAESLEKIEENRRNMVANISHDLRSPMTSIRGFIEGILDGTIPEEKHEHYLKVVLEECKRLIKITNDLLELSNMQQGKVEAKMSAFELNETIRRKLVAFEHQITAKQLEASLVLHGEKVQVNSDQMFIERILSNLLDNAVKFTPEKGEIIIRTEEVNDRIWVEVINTGVSINAEEMKKIWERFHKGDTSRGQFKSGFGLGLAIVKEMISKLEEKIWLESENGYVKFIFTIKKA